MDFDICRERFSLEAFDTKQLLNTLYSSSASLNESDIVSFKLQVIQREISNEIDINSTNVLKASKTILSDLSILSSLHSGLLGKVDALAKQSKHLSFEPQKAVTYINANSNLTKAIAHLDKNKSQ